jgi:hypothetical protein
MQPETHAEKYKSFLEGLSAYMQRLSSPKPKKQRKGKGMEALLQWRDQPTGSAVQSNWSLTADNDNHLIGEDSEERSYVKEMVREIEPSVNLILREAAKAKYKDVPSFASFSGKKARKERYPVAGDVEFGKHYEVRDVDGDKVETEHAVVTSIGSLRFSDGTQTEKALVRGEAGKIVEQRVNLPVGAILGTRERLRKEKGSTRVWGATNKVWSKMLDGKPQASKIGKKKPVKKGKARTVDELREMLAAATANTIEKYGELPPVTKCPPGFPREPKRAADMFLAGKKSQCAGGGAMAWQDMYYGLLGAREWRRAMAELLPTDVKVLDAAMTAKNYGDIGAVVGHTGEYGRKAGKRMLRAANDNLAEALKKYVA